ncbi:MAG: hypothetical protein K2W95_15570 [Candidatus Obscuribacterales bacterium]|nr:hypothetical protein [Candidatus Obscuribacterales bacterium]
MSREYFHLPDGDVIAVDHMGTPKPKPVSAKCMYCEQTICIDDLEPVSETLYSCKNVSNCRLTVWDTLSEHRDAMATLEHRYNELKGFIVTRASHYIWWSRENKGWQTDSDGYAWTLKPHDCKLVFEEALQGLIAQWRESRGRMRDAAKR